jgi:hypothetical protein
MVALIGGDNVFLAVSTTTARGVRRGPVGPLSPAGAWAAVTAAHAQVSAVWARLGPRGRRRTAGVGAGGSRHGLTGAAHGAPLGVASAHGPLHAWAA